MRIFSNGRRSTILAIAVIAIFLITLVVVIVLYLYPAAPKIGPMKHFKTVRSAGCFALALDTCRTSYYYVAEGSLATVVDQVYETLSKNQNYDIHREPDDQGLYITIKNADPNGPVSKREFGIDFITPPGPADAYTGSFIPTDTCRAGSTHCVEALLIK
jgi:hypothetical protein